MTFINALHSPSGTQQATPLACSRLTIRLLAFDHRLVRHGRDEFASRGLMEDEFSEALDEGLVPPRAAP